MPRSGTRAPELAIPVACLSALRQALTAEVGPDTAARALRAAGHAAGDAWYPRIDGNDEAGAVSESRFWRRLSQLFHSHGWGSLTHEAVHPGVGALDANDWVEARPEAGESRPSCFFTTGLLANLLGNAAGSDVAVMEVECRSQGDPRCRFLFGSADALNALYARVSSGDAVDAALSKL
ncbi:MAG TPA: V4R domain-containing protein [Longimicrobiales bacterium]